MTACCNSSDCSSSFDSSDLSVVSFDHFLCLLSRYLKSSYISPNINHFSTQKRRNKHLSSDFSLTSILKLIIESLGMLRLSNDFLPYQILNSSEHKWILHDLIVHGILVVVGIEAA